MKNYLTSLLQYSAVRTYSCLLFTALLVLTGQHLSAQTECSGDAVVLAKWDINGSIDCNGLSNTASASAPIFTGGKQLCPSFNEGSGQTIMLTKGFGNTFNFKNAICLAGFWAKGTSRYGNAYKSSPGWDINDTEFRPENVGGQIFIKYNFNAGQPGAITGLSLVFRQSGYVPGGVISFQRQGVSVYRNGVLIHSDVMDILPGNVNATPITFTFPNTADFRTDGSTNVTFEVGFGLVQRNADLLTGYDDVCILGGGGAAASPDVSAQPATCAPSGGMNGQLIVNGSGPGERYDFNQGTTYTGGLDYDSATPIPSGGVITNTLPLVEMATSYTVRIFRRTDGEDCYVEQTVVMPPTFCPYTCDFPDATVTPNPATCTGEILNDDASIVLTGITNMDRIGFSEGKTYTGPDYTGATPTGGAATFSFDNLAADACKKFYTIRLFNGTGGAVDQENCIQDITVAIDPVSCDGCAIICADLVGTDSELVNPPAAAAMAEACKDDGFVDIGISKTVSPATGESCPANTEFTWTLTATNSGTMDATDITVRDLLPENMIILSANATGGLVLSSSEHIDWQIDLLAMGSSVTLTVVSVFTMPGSYQNCASVVDVFPANDPNTGNDESCDNITVTGSIRPSIEKEFSPLFGQANVPFRLTIKLFNNDIEPIALTAALVDDLPSAPGQMVIAATPALVTSIPGVVATAGGTSITVPSGTVLQPGLNSIQVDVVAPADGFYLNEIPAGALQTTGCSNPESAEATIDLNSNYVIAPVISKAFGADMLAVGQQTLLTLTIDNRNTQNFEVAADFADEMPAGLIVTGAVGGTCPGGSTFGSTDQLGIAQGTILPPGACTVTVQVEGTAAGLHCNLIPYNSLMVDVLLAGGVNVAISNQDLAEACIEVVNDPVFDLALRKKLAPMQADTVEAGGSVSFAITIFNQGTTAATDIQVTDYIATGLSLIDDANWNPSGSNAVLANPIPSLAAGADTTIIIQFDIDAGFTGESITNTAEISAANGGTDKDSTPDDLPSNDNGGLVQSPTDDVVLGNGKNPTGAPGDTNGLTDEDDADPAIIFLRPAPTINCSVVLSAAPGSCDVADGNYDLMGSISFTNPPAAGTLTISVDGAVVETFATFANPQAFTVANLASDGLGHTVTAAFSDNASCFASLDYTSPDVCEDAGACTVSITAVPGACDPATNAYSLSGELTFSDAPADGTLTVSVGPFTQVFTAPFTSPTSYELTGLGANGSSQTVTVSFSSNAGCTNNADFNAPASCTPGVCGIALTASPGTCVPATNTFDVTGTLTFTDAPDVGTLTVSAGGQSQSFTPPFTSPQAYTLSGLISDGSTRAVTAAFSDAPNCTAEVSVLSPVDCSAPGSPVCGVSLKVSPSPCTDGTYSLSGLITFVDPPATGNLVLSEDGATFLTVALPVSSPLSFNLPDLVSDLAAHTITVAFSDDVTCSNTASYMAPDGCAATCELMATATDVTCNDNGTGTEATDDYLSFKLNPTGMGFGSGYTVTSTGGPVFQSSGSAATGVAFGAETMFRLANGSAGAGDVTLTITDDTDPTCTATAMVTDPGACAQACDLSITAAPSTCNDTDNSYELVITATYENAPAGDISITVAGGSPMTFTPSGTSPDMFTISGLDSDGATTVAVAAIFVNDAGCTASVTYDAPVECFIPVSPSMPCAGNSGDIGGTVFQDLNNDGDGVGVEPGQEDIIVMVFDCDGNTVGNTTTGADGQWSVSGLTDGEQYRVEFTFPASLAYLQPSANGADNGTDVQFASPVDCNVDFGVIDPTQYCNDNPLVAVVCFPRNNDAGGEPVIVFLATDDARDWPGPAIAGDTDGRWGIPSGGTTVTYPDVAATFATKAQVETTFGLDWDRKNSQLYSGAYMRAYASMGTNASANRFAEGAIYNIPIDLTSSSSMTPSIWLDLETLFGDDFAGTYIADTPFPGSQVFGRNNNNPNLIGYTGLGSIKLAADNSEMYVVNLASREVLVIPIGADGTAPTSAAAIRRFPVPNTPCDGAWPDGRPLSSVLGLGVHPVSGRVYATMTCTGPTLPDVTGYVYSFDPADATPSSTDFTLELTIPLDIKRPAASPNTNQFWEQIDHPWETLAANAVSYNNDPRVGGNASNQIPQELVSHHIQPWLGEVGFAAQPDGSFAMVVGERNRYHDIINSSFYVAGGVLYRACGEDGNWTLESGGSCGTANSSVAYTMTGTRAGQFVSPQNQFFYYVGREGSMGAGTVDVPLGGSEIVIPAMDNIFNSSTSGLAWLSTVDGGRLRDARILGDFTGPEFDNTNFTKANNWGAITALCAPVSIQIGNYVWIDTDMDGVQDPCEPPVPNLPVTLIDKTTGNVIAVTTTDPITGQYYFSETADGLEHNTPYAIVFGYDGNTPGNSVFAGGTFTLGGMVYELTGTDASTEGATDLNDSDASLMTQGSLVDYPIIMYTTADSTDHTLDVGLAPVISFDLALTKVETSVGPYSPGDNVTFTIEVFNQGNVDATDVEVTDYVPTGMTFNPALNAGNAFAGNTDLLAPVATIANIAAGTSETVEIVLTIDLNFLGMEIVNNAEITSFDDDNDPGTAPPVDEDSTPGDNEGGDEIATDNDIDDSFPGTPGTIDNPGDADDYDPAAIMVTQPPCVINITNVDVQCTNGTDFTVSFDVTWDNLNALLDMIEVTVDGDAQAPFTPLATNGTTSFGPIALSSPAFGIFLEATFLQNTDCATATTVDLVACTEPCSDPGLGGNVFNDFNNDGADAGAGEVGQANVLVEIYECDSDVPVATAWTNADGDWSVDDAGITYPVRVEFSTPLLDYLQPGIAGANNGSNTQFVEASSCDIDYGVIDLNTACPAAVVEAHAIGNLSAEGTLLSSGIAIVTCGIIVDASIPANNQYTLGLIDVRNVTLADNRPQGTLTDYHHPDWTVTQIGNVFGTTTDKAGNFYATASSHYGSAFGYILGGDQSNFRPSVIRYGEIGGGANDVGAAGTVYKMDAATGQPTVFAQLPQQSFSFTHIACEQGNSISRTSGPGLGNIEFDEVHQQFFVSNFEDGKIYRLAMDGTQIDDFDPQTLPGFTVDDGTAGFANDFKPYGMAVSPDGSRLYFGVHTVDNNPATSLTDANVYYVNLAADGSFSGVEQFVVTTTPDAPGTAFGGDINAFGKNPAWYSVSDLNFNPDRDLVIGHRSGCGDGTNPVFASSHNHGASYFIYDLDAGTLLNIQSRYAGDIGNTGLDGTGNDDVYGGIGIWDTHDGDYTYVVSSSDTRNEFGPHGLLLFANDFTQTGNGTTQFVLRPSAALPYFVNFSSNDFKGVGGDAEVYSPCGPVAIQIGNYVWIDADEDGVQDACEAPLPGVPVSLYNKDTGMWEDVQTTGADGEYYFNNVEPNTNYAIVFGYDHTISDGPWDATTGELTVNGIPYALTTADADGTNPLGPDANDLNDSDASLMDMAGLTQYPIISYMTSYSTDHTLDVGLIKLAAFDLALRKTINTTASPGPYQPGDAVTFTVKVFNQGDIDATDVEVTDYAPTGLTFTSVAAGTLTTDNGATATVTDNGGGVFTIDALASGDSLAVDITLTIDVSFMGVELVNYAEITSFDDDNNPLTDPPVDEDSTPGDNPGLDETGTDNNIDDDGIGGNGTPDDPTDNDDYDPAILPVLQTFDLALTKVLDVSATPGPFTIGSPVAYVITVFNQGTLDATDIEVSDYAPDGLTLVPGGGWTDAGGGIVTLDAPFDLAAGGMQTLNISFTIDADFTGTELINSAEITAANNALGLPDEDSTPGDNVNDPPETATDDNVDDDGLNGNGTADRPDDADDFDPVQIMVEYLSIGSTVFIDANNNGEQEAGEAGVEGVTVEVYAEGTTPGVDAPVGSDTTDPNGDYFVGGLAPGNYFVVINTAPASAPISSNGTTSGFTETDPDDNQDNDDEGLQPGGSGTTVTSGLVTLALRDEPVDGTGAGTEFAQGNLQDNGEIDANGNMTLDFGFFAPVTVGDTAFVDVDMDGTQSPGDLPLPGVTVFLLDSNGDPATTDAEGNTITGETMTDASGSYSFGNLPPGSYSVVFDISTADNAEFFTFTTANTGDDANDSDNSISLTETTAQSDPTPFLNSGEADLTLDVGVACALEVTVANPFTICSTGTIDLTVGSSVTPLFVIGASWETSGNGRFLDALGVELVHNDPNPVSYGQAATYIPGSQDISRGYVILTLTTNDPPVETGCAPVSASVRVEILKVDCGEFMWDGQ